MTIGFCGLLLVGACLVLAPLNLRRLELTLRVPHRFHASREVPFEAELRNGRRLLAAYEIEILLRFPQKVERFGHADWTPAGGVSTLQERLSIPNRSCSESVDYELASQFPFGFFEVRRAHSVSCPILVYPRLLTPIELLVQGLQFDVLPSAGLASGDTLGEPRGIRLYQPGDAANRIHHPATARSLARGHGPRVRAYDPPGFHPHRCRIVFHSHVPAGEMIRFDHFERGLSLVAGTLAYFLALSSKACLQASFTEWQSHPCESRTQFFDCLTLLAQVNRPARTPAETLSEVLANVPVDEQLILISDSPPQAWIGLVPSDRQKVIVIDIRQIRAKRREFQLVR